MLTSFERVAYEIKGTDRLPVECEVETVSYTHLDVYKRQAKNMPFGIFRNDIKKFCRKIIRNTGKHSAMHVQTKILIA